MLYNWIAITENCRGAVKLDLENGIYFWISLKYRRMSSNPKPWDHTLTWDSGELSLQCNIEGLVLFSHISRVGQTKKGFSLIRESIFTLLHDQIKISFSESLCKSTILLLNICPTFFHLLFTLIFIILFTRT